MDQKSGLSRPKIIAAFAFLWLLSFPAHVPEVGGICFLVALLVGATYLLIDFPQIKKFWDEINPDVTPKKPEITPGIAPHDQLYCDQLRQVWGEFCDRIGVNKIAIDERISKSALVRRRELVKKKVEVYDRAQVTDIYSTNRGLTWVFTIPQGAQLATFEKYLPYLATELGTDIEIESAGIGYAAETAEWAKEFEHELQESVVSKLVGLWSGTSQGKTIALGAGAQRLKERMSSVSDAYNTTPTTVIAKIGDDRLLRNLLRDEFSTFRWGTLNHCLGITEQALCLEGIASDVAAQGMIPNQCQPVTCRNSVITDQHLPIWIAEEHDLMTKLKDKKMAPHNREQLESELATVQKITRKVAHGS